MAPSDEKVSDTLPYSIKGKLPMLFLYFPNTQASHLYASEHIDYDLKWTCNISRKNWKKRSNQKFWGQSENSMTDSNDT